VDIGKDFIDRKLGFVLNDLMIQQWMKLLEMDDEMRVKIEKRVFVTVIRF
jgi:hypothetical protein